MAIDRRLRRGEWAAAESEARAEIADQLAAKGGGLPAAVAELAVAEAGQGKDEDALAHWQAVQGMTGTTPDVSYYGAPGQLLDAKVARSYGQAPDALVVRREGDGGGPFAPAHRISGDEPTLPGTYRGLPRGIRVEVIVDAQGRPLQPVVAASTFPALTYVVLEAMRGWRFKPAATAGEPVASFFVLSIPEPRPLDRLADFAKSPLAEPLGMLAAGRYADAEKRLGKIWDGAMDDAAQTRAFLGMALALKALAEAGLGRDDAAICRYQAAQTMEPRLFGADLSSFGRPGALLMRHPWASPMHPWRKAFPLGAATPTPAGVAIPPKILDRKPPRFPSYARQLLLQGRLEISSIITAAGALRDLTLWTPAVSAGFDAAALDAVCDWRFEPATLAGKPVVVYYSLTVNYELRPRH
jgi:TonB family protein